MGSEMCIRDSLIIDCHEIIVTNKVIILLINCYQDVIDVLVETNRNKLYIENKLHLKWLLLAINDDDIISIIITYYILLYLSKRHTYFVFTKTLS